MNMCEAIQIVLDLAVQNMCEEQENPEEYKRQDKAVGKVMDLQRTYE